MAIIPESRCVVYTTSELNTNNAVLRIFRQHDFVIITVNNAIIQTRMNFLQHEHENN